MRIFFAFLLSITLAVSSAIADNKMEMGIAYISGSSPLKSVIVLRSPASDYTVYEDIQEFQYILKNHVGENISLEWWPSDVDLGEGMAILSTSEEIERFKAFCKENNINLTIHPGG